jgi:hypothetical protein
VDILGSEPFTLAKQAVQASRFCQEAVFSVLPYIDKALDQLQDFRFQKIPADEECVQRYYEGPGSIPFLLVGFLDAFKRFVLPKEYRKAFRERAPALRHHLDGIVQFADFSSVQPASEEEGAMQMAILDVLDHCFQGDLDGDDTASIHFIARHSHIPRYEQVMIRMIKSLHLRDEKRSKAASVSTPTTSVAVDASPPPTTEIVQATPPSPLPLRPAKRARTSIDFDLPCGPMDSVRGYGESLLGTYPRIGALVGLSADIFKATLLSVKSLKVLFVVFSALMLCGMDGVRPIAASIREALEDETRLRIASRGADLWYPKALRLLDLFCRGESLILSPHLP